MPNILVIEDNPVSSTLLAEHLRGQGYTVEEAVNGRVATSMFERGGFDLVITDIVMPEQEGVGSILAIRRMNRNVPIIAVSASSFPAEGPSYLDIAMSLGASGAMTKPLDWDKLTAMVDRSLER